MPGLVVRDPGFKSLFLPLDGFVFGGLELNSSTCCESQMVSLLLVFINYIVTSVCMDPV